MEQHELILTVSSRARIEAELNEMRTVRRPEVTESIRRARSYGDLSENFEYHAARQAQAILNGRIAELEALLERAKIVEDRATGGDSVGLNSMVTVRDLDNEDEWEFTIVDATSADPINDRISYSSPVGQALMNKVVGETVEVAIPNGHSHYEIVSIRH